MLYLLILISRKAVQIEFQEFKSRDKLKEENFKILKVVYYII